MPTSPARAGGNGESWRSRGSTENLMQVWPEQACDVRFRTAQDGPRPSAALSLLWYALLRVQSLSVYRYTYPGTYPGTYTGT